MNDTIYQRLKAAGCDLDHHESDLYVRNTDAARTVLAEWEQIEPATPLTIKPFISEADGDHWFDLPFQFDPFWESKPR